MKGPRRRHVQGELDLGAERRGGARPGAGRPKKGPRASEPHQRRAIVNPRAPLHVVIRAVRGERLRARDGWRAVKHALLVTARRHAFRICHVSVQATHVHVIVEADDRVALARGMQGFEIACAKRYNRLRRRRGRLFEDRYHPAPLATPRQVRNALAYVLKQLAQARRG